MRGRDVGGEGTWNDDAPSNALIVPEKTIQVIAKTEKQIRRSEQKEQQKKKLSDWDQLLDSGRQKKIRTGRPNSLDTYMKQENTTNFFQEYQNYIQERKSHGDYYEDYRDPTSTGGSSNKGDKSSTMRQKNEWNDEEEDDDDDDEDKYDEKEMNMFTKQKSKSNSFQKKNHQHHQPSQQGRKSFSQKKFVKRK